MRRELHDKPRFASWTRIAEAREPGRDEGAVRNSKLWLLRRSHSQRYIATIVAPTPTTQALNARRNGKGAMRNSMKNVPTS